MKTIRCVFAASALVLAAPAGAQQGAEGGSVSVNGAEITFGGRVQTQFNTTTVQSEPTGEFLLRRVRLEAAVKLSELVSARVQPEFAGSRVALRDAWVRLGFSPALQVTAGQQHRPFGVLTQASSTRIPVVERGARIRGVEDPLEEQNLVTGLGYADRDVGLLLSGAPGGAPLGLSYAAGVFNGPARAELEHGEDSYQLSARAAVEAAEGVRVGASWSTRDFGGGAAEEEEPHTHAGVDPGHDGALHRGYAWALDLEYGAFAPGLHFMGEVATGDAQPDFGVRFFGAQGWIAYRTRELGRRLVHVEPHFRVSYGDPDRRGPGEDLPGGTLVTPGVNLYLGGLNRVMFDYDLWLPTGNRAGEGSFKAMLQVAF